MATTEPPEIASRKQSIANVPDGIKTYVESNENSARHIGFVWLESDIVAHDSEQNTSDGMKNPQDDWAGMNKHQLAVDLDSLSTKSRILNISPREQRNVE